MQIGVTGEEMRTWFVPRQVTGSRFSVHAIGVGTGGATVAMAPSLFSGEPVAQGIVLGLLIQWSRVRFPGKSVGGQYRPLHLRPGRPWNRVRVPLVVGHW